MVRKLATTPEQNMDMAEYVGSGAAQTSLALREEFTFLQSIVERAYDEGVSIEDAERLAAKCIGVQLKIATEMARLDLDARMKKNGLKAIKAAVYMETVNRADKKPSDTLIEQVVTLDTNVSAQQTLFDSADAEKEALSVFLGIFRDAHVFFRTVARGAYNG